MSGPNIQAGGWEIGIAPRASLALTFAATSLFHAYVEFRPADSQAHGWRVYVQDTYPVDHTDYSEPQIGPGQPATVEVTRRVPGEVETRKVDTFHVTATPYARDFDSDPAVEVINEGAVDDLEQLADRLKAEGWENITFKVQGVASAEDATRDGIAGVQTPSDDNLRTANARGNALHRYLQDNADLPGVQLELLPGVEGELDESQVHLLQTYVERFGYEPRGDMSAVEVMIDQWNLDPQSVPPEVDADLQLLLGDMNRGDLVMVYATRQVTGQETTRTEPELVCMVPVQPTETRYLVAEPWRTTIPWIIPIIVPYAKRREDRDGGFVPPALVAVPSGAGGGPDPGPGEPLPPRTPLRQVPAPRERYRTDRRIWLWGALILLGGIAGGIALGQCDLNRPVPPPPTVPSNECPSDLRVVEQPTGKTKVVTVINDHVRSTTYK